MIKIKADLVRGTDLKPGDLFSTAGPEYWASKAMNNGSVGEAVYIRTNTPAEIYDDADEPIYRIIIERDAAS